jgi:uncharacterized protein YigE (DUF2233 family)
VAETQAFSQRPGGPGDAIRADAGDKQALASVSTGAALRSARNGVGVRADGKVIFAISQGEVSFDAFARLFRDGLNCPNALFLDGGSASSLYAPSLNSHGNILSLGPMLAVFERDQGATRH